MLLQHPLPGPRKRRRRLPLGCSTRELPQQRCLELCHILAAFDILGEGKEAPLFLLYCFVFPKWDRHPPPWSSPLKVSSALKDSVKVLGDGNAETSPFPDTDWPQLISVCSFPPHPSRSVLTVLHFHMQQIMPNCDGNSPG